MKIGIGNDHTGLELKAAITKHLESKNYQVVNYGTNSTEPYDYPLAGNSVAKAILNKEVDLGILICGTGIGITLAANKNKGIRAAVGCDTYSAKMARIHNNCQIISFGSRIVAPVYALEVVDAFLEAEFGGDRHQTRVDMITAIEEGNL